MKTGFISDIHLGAGRDLGVGEYGEGSRFADQCAVLDRAASLFVAEGCDVVCCLGDVFHTPQPKPWEILAWHRFLGPLAANGIQTITILGNHDVKAAELPTALDLGASEWHQVVSRPRLVPHNENAPDAPVVFACLPWTPLSTLIARRGRTDVVETAVDLLVATMEKLRNEARDKYPDAPCVLLGHWAVSGGSLPNGLPLDALHEPIIPQHEIGRLNFDAAILGHIHKAQDIADTPYVGYVGTPMPHSFGEEVGSHGVMVMEVGG